jgi:hypothetical protein
MSQTNRLLTDDCGSHAQHEAGPIREQLQRILASPAFSTSKRCHMFLRHVVEETLLGRREMLKERTLGIEVFHRDPMYDTTSDPVVRMAAGEVRKRLAQYYYDPAHAHEIHIELPPGSYVPLFQFNGSEQSEKTPIPLSIVIDAPATESKPSAKEFTAQLAVATKPLKGMNALAILLALLLGVFCGIWGPKLHPFARTNAIDEFWGPFTSSSKTILICVGEIYTTELHISPNQAQNGLNQPLQIHTPLMGDVPVFVQEDAVALARISSMLQSRNKGYLIRGAASTTYSDLKESPSILMGSYTNDWTIRLNDRLRFYFDADETSGRVWIADRQKPSQQIGLHSAGKGSASHEAYAIVSRFYDPTTEQMTLAVGGKGKAMLAAAEFVANPSYLEQFSKQVPTDWYKRNMQVLIRTNIVEGSVGPPQIADTYFW